MNAKLMFNVSSFEPISDIGSEKLIGGFSTSFSVSMVHGSDINDVGSNNCAGGNCVSGCGNGQNIHCSNAVPGCGGL